MGGKENLTNAITSEHFDNLARNLGVNSGGNIDKYSTIGNLLLPAKTHPKVLECGGGAGFYTQHLLANNYQVTCVDLSSAALAVNRDRADQNGNGCRLATVNDDFVNFCEFSDTRFDQIVFIKVLHHFESIDTIDQALLSALKMLKPNGQVLIFEPNGSNPMWKAILSILRDPVSGKSKWHIERNMKFTTGMNLSLLLAHYAHRVHLCYHYAIPGAVLCHRWANLFRLTKLNDLLLRLPIARFLALNLSIKVGASESRIASPGRQGSDG